MKKIIFALLLLVTVPVRAEPIGLHVNSLEGLNETECNTLLEAYDGVKRPSIGFLWKSFKKRFPDGFSCLNEFIRRYGSGDSHIKVYANDATCRRPPRYCDSTQIRPWLRISGINSALEKRDRKLLMQYRDRGRRIKAYFDQFPELKSKISFVYFLEDNLSNKAFKNAKREMDRSIPSSWRRGRSSVNNPEKINIYGSDFIELHEFEYAYYDRRTVDFSNDGIDVDLGGRYRPLRNYLPVASVFTAIRSIRRNENSGEVLFWWNNQGARERGFILPRNRTGFQLYSENISLINKYLKD